MPCREAVDADRQQFHLVEGFDRVDAVAQRRHERHDAIAERLETFGAELRLAALADHIAALPDIAAIDHHKDRAGRECPAGRDIVVRALWQREPQHVHRRADVDRLHACRRADRGMTAVARDDDISLDREGTVRALHIHARDAAALLGQAGRRRLHQQREMRIVLVLLHQEIQEIPLRHDDKSVDRLGQHREIGDGEDVVANLAGQRGDRPVRQGEEFFEQAEFVHQAERRGMDRVATEIAQEIRMFLQHDHVDPAAGEKRAEHHAGRAPADHDATGPAGLRHGFGSVRLASDG